MLESELAEFEAFALAYRVEKNRERVRLHLAAGNVERASYYADRVLRLLGFILNSEVIG